MQYVGKVFSTVSQLYKELNPATLSGAIDVVVVEDKDGNLSCSPFHVRFGKLQLLRPSDKAVQVLVNGTAAEFYMKVGDSGEAFFVVETESDVPSRFATSPVASPALSFREADDPDFLDLSGAMGRVVGDQLRVNDGYVSAHGSESGSEDERSDVGTSAGSHRRKASVSRLRRTPSGLAGGFDDAHSDGEAQQDIWRQRQRRTPVVFSDDMSMIRSRRSERLLERIGEERLLALASAIGSATDRTTPGGARPASFVSDSAFELGVSGGSANDNNSDDVLEKDGGPEQLHSEWDWGVKLTPSTQGVVEKPANQQIANKIDDKVQPLAHILDVTELLASAAAEPGRTLPVLNASLCGVDALQTAADGAAQQLVFEQARVAAPAFSDDPIGVLTNPRLVFRQASGEYVQGEALVLALVSQLAYGVPLDRGLQRVSRADDANSGSQPVVCMPGTQQQQQQQQEKPHGDQIQTEQRALAGDSVAGDESSGQPKSQLKIENREPAPAKPEGRRWWRWGQRTPAAASTQTTVVSATAEISAKAEISTGGDSVSVNLPPAGSDVAGASEFSGDEAGAVGGYLSDDGVVTHPLAQPQPQHPMRYAKTLRLTSEQLRSLNLKHGANEIKFLVPSNNAYCEAKLYLYRWDTQIVISDIDGTITKSDALGHLFNMVGKDWTHHGVAKLFTDIASNGYQILYLTSRAIGQADGTRDFLANVNQAGYRLPGGPLLLSPDRLFTSFHREVIMKRPQEFKMACLRDIRNLFGDQLTPFYAGFGNRITDAMSYRSVNVPVSRICTIDSYGEIKLDLLPGYRSSYVKINDLVDMMFPPLSTKLDPTYNDWEYWKRALPEIDDELAEIDAMLAEEEAREKEAKKKKPAPVAVSPPRSNSMYTRNSRSASNAGGSPLIGQQQSPDRQPAILHLAQTSFQSNVRQRADSWTTTTTGNSRAATDLIPGPVSNAVAGHAEPEQLVNGTARNRMSLLKKASSAFSPFSLVRGSSPPLLPDAGSATFDYDQQLSSSTEEPPSSTAGAFPSLSSSQKPKYVSAASTFSYSAEASADAIIGESHLETGNASFNFSEMREADVQRTKNDDDDDDVDPMVAVAAAKLVPQFDDARPKSASSRLSFRSSEYSDEEDVDSDIEDEQDEEEEDDDEPIDQEMLDIMHDMEQVQRLE
ncbi:lipin Ned1 [Coemansia sp. RSA 1722]|nr:lipin Ned1 [Coemansia sp. RSA 486]KAJ2238027.1 lipin Ned1 [Coemansia sp. RSA 485]KAJ2603614.1 lipin Ned1 [Coemansia sp. RSA 1721]KAJ2606215.1 lipin Ned1 [Coemansia sp. RSA 1722]KAJ2639661.1 lipin Ned1 [Coemansia sp. RSA 1286]